MKFNLRMNFRVHFLYAGYKSENAMLGFEASLQAKR